jgi:hypothetical protein
MRETCTRLGVTRQTVNNLVKRGKLTKHARPIGHGIGGQHVYFDAVEVDALSVIAASAEIGEDATRAKRAPKRKSKRGAK